MRRHYLNLSNGLEALDALRIVGEWAELLGATELDPRLSPGLPPEGREGGAWRLPALGPWPGGDALTDAEALGWTALAAWLEGGVRPIEPLRWQTGHLGYRVRLLGAARTIAEARPENFRAVARLARALRVARAWARPGRPWGLRDFEVERLRYVEREAEWRAAGSGPGPLIVVRDPIPPGYLAAFGTASE